MSSSLKTDRKYPWFMMACGYITQYIGVAFFMTAAVSILRQQGMALDKLSLLNLIALPLMGKIFYAPFIDKYRLFFRGKYRSWLIGAQSSMILCLMLASTISLEQQFLILLGVLAFYVLSVSIQDVAIDGLACKLADAKTRKFASSIQFSSNLFGNILGGGIILMFYPWLEWQGALWLLASVTSFSLLQTLFFLEPKEPIEKALNSNYSNHFFKDIKHFILQQKAWFIILALYPVGSSFGFALLNPMLVDSGWKLDEIGFAMKVFGSIIGVVAALLATPLIARIGRKKVFFSAIFLQVFSFFLILPLTFGFIGKPIVYIAIAVHFISFPTLLVTSSTIMMDKVAKRINKATFFTLQFSFASFLGFIYSMLSMNLASHVGYRTVLIGGAVVTFMIAIIILFIFKQMKGKREVYPFHTEYIT